MGLEFTITVAHSAFQKFRLTLNKQAVYSLVALVLVGYGAVGLVRRVRVAARELAQAGLELGRAVARARRQRRRPRRRQARRVRAGLLTGVDVFCG